MGCRQETGRCWPEFRAPCRSPCEMIWRGCFRLVLTTVSAYNDITQDGSTPLGLAEAFGSPGMLIGEAGAWRRWRSGVNMERACPLCGREYAVRSFGLDSGHCAECRPRFLSRPLWFAPTEAGRRSVWQFVLTIHVFYILLFLPLTCGALSYPASLYSFFVSVYSAGQFSVYGRRKHPILTKAQVIGLLLLPVYGLAAFLMLFFWVQELRYGM